MQSIDGEKFCTRCGVRLPANSTRCASCGFDSAASPGAPPAESLEARVARLEADKSSAAKTKK
jgi:hypothetical protein